MAMECNITFDDNKEKVFYSGQVLSGQVILTLAVPKKVRGIYVQIDGNANTRWDVGTAKRPFVHESTEKYIEERTYLVDGRSGDEITLQPGTHTYPFRCNLPMNLPTSMEASNGHIRYVVRVNINRPSVIDENFEECVTVIKSIDLNKKFSYREPIVAERTRTFSWCCLIPCIQSDVCHVMCRLPVSAYAPGQTINVEIKTDNKSDQDVTHYAIELIKRIEFEASAGSSTKHKYTSDTVATTNTDLPTNSVDYSEGCKRGESTTRHLEMMIPPTPPTDTETSRIIKIEYTFIIYPYVTGCHFCPTIEHPITIGTQPIVSFAPLEVSGEKSPIQIQPLAANSSSSEPSAPSKSGVEDSQQEEPLLHPKEGESSGATQPSAPYPEDDPLTYEEASTETGSGANDTDDRFAPKYPVFRKPTTYSSGSK